MHEHHLEGRHSDRLSLIRRSTIPPDLWRPLISSGQYIHFPMDSSAPGVPNHVEREADEAFTQDGEACVANVSSAYSQQPHRLQPCIRRLCRYWPIGGPARTSTSVSHAARHQCLDGRLIPMSQSVGSWTRTVFVLIALPTGTGHFNVRVMLYPTTPRNQSWIRQQNPAEI